MLPAQYDDDDDIYIYIYMRLDKVKLILLPYQVGL